MNKLTCALLAVGLTLVWSTAALAISVKNKERLEEHFANLGMIHYELYAPLGGTEAGGVVIDDGDGTGTLHIARVDGKKITVLLTKSLPDLDTNPPFTFLLTGFHTLVYVTRDWTDDTGRHHRRGDLEVYDIEPDTEGEEVPRLLYELKDVCDLSFQAGGGMNNNNLLWQPASHFLNTSGLLPVKNNYFEFSFDPEEETYFLTQHLKALPDAAEVDYANFNNRALLSYRSHRLQHASLLLKRASDVAQTSQSIILRNQAMIESEVDDLESQAEMFPERPADEALQFFWQGDFAGVLRIMEVRSRSGFTDFDAALIGLSLANEGRWPESDEVTGEMHSRNVPFLSDYHWELAKIAESQGHGDIAASQLLAMESLDRSHPGYIVGLFRLLNVSGESSQARGLLEDYLLAPHPGRNLTEARLQLFELYYREANSIGCDRLIKDSLGTPIIDLLGYVLMEDYIDLSTALTDVPLDTSGRIIAPEKPLETFGVE